MWVVKWWPGSTLQCQGEASNNQYHLPWPRSADARCVDWGAVPGYLGGGGGGEWLRVDNGAVKTLSGGGGGSLTKIFYLSKALYPVTWPHSKVKSLYYQITWEGGGGATAPAPKCHSWYRLVEFMQYSWCTLTCASFINPGRWIKAPLSHNILS